MGQPWIVLSSHRALLAWQHQLYSVSTLASVLLRPGVFSCDPCSLEGARPVESCFCQAGPVWAKGGFWMQRFSWKGTSWWSALQYKIMIMFLFLDQLHFTDQAIKNPGSLWFSFPDLGEVRIINLQGVFAFMGCLVCHGVMQAPIKQFLIICFCLSASLKRGSIYLSIYSCLWLLWFSNLNEWHQGFALGSHCSMGTEWPDEISKFLKSDRILMVLIIFLWTVASQVFWWRQSFSYPKLLKLFINQLSILIFLRSGRKIWWNVFSILPPF